jgi:D-aminopeptidase
MNQVRARDVGITIGTGTPGPRNAITDVAGVRVGHTTVIRGNGPRRRGEGPVRTGVTVIRPRPGLARAEPLFAGCHRLNGNGQMTGLEWIREAGILATDIALTNTHSVGTVHDALVRAELDARSDDGIYWSMPVVGETYDGLLNDVDGQHVTADHVFAALEAATDGDLAEGAVGGGTGMICHEFKGGIGTASRRLADDDGGWIVGVLVQANQGRRELLRVDGYPVGRVLDCDWIPSPFPSQQMPNGGMGSIVVIVATDAPLLPIQCQRLAQRAGVGVARCGGGVDDNSGDLFLAFSAGNRTVPRTDYAAQGPHTFAVEAAANPYLTPLFDAVAEATEEAIVNALLAAETVTGADDQTAHGLEPRVLLEALRRVGWRAV